MTALTRTGSGFFRIEDSHSIEEVIEAAEDGKAVEEMIVPADTTLEKLGKAVLDDNRITAFLNGNSTWSSGFTVTEPSGYENMYRVYAKDGFLGIAAIENGSLVPKKVLR